LQRSNLLNMTDDYVDLDEFQYVKAT